MENFIVIPGTNEKYSVNNCGKVLSRYLDRCLKAFEKNGYLYVSINGRNHTVHSLVLLAFKGPRPQGYVINHINGDKADNRIDNLEYCTQSHNRREDFRTGRQSLAGEKNNVCKLTEHDVMTIIEMYNSGEYTYAELAKDFNVSKGEVSNIINGLTWSYLTGIKSKN